MFDIDLLLFFQYFQILGIGTVIVNSLGLPNYSDEARLICIVMIVLGSIVFLISFFGCCGAIRENICLTWTVSEKK